MQYITLRYFYIVFLNDLNLSLITYVFMYLFSQSPSRTRLSQWMMHIRSTRDVSLDERNTTHTLQTTNVVLLVSLHLVKIILFLYLIRNSWWLEINCLGIKSWFLCLVNFQFSIRKELPSSSMDNNFLLQRFFNYGKYLCHFCFMFYNCLFYPISASNAHNV